MAAPIECREPIFFAIGDTLNFQRYLRDYLPGAGWAMKYEIRGDGADNKPIELVSQANGDFHQVIATPDVTSQWLPGDYLLAGYVFNAGTGERHQIYLAQLTLQPDQVAAKQSAPVKTYAQQMVETLRVTYAALNQSYLKETDIQRTRVLRVERDKLRLELNFWEDRRNYELKQQAMANGYPNPNVVAPVFQIG